MGIEYIFYNILKEMGISINENEKKSDIEKIRYWVNSRFNKRHLEKVCKKLKGMSYPNYKKDEIVNFLYFGEAYISESVYEYLYWKSCESQNYIRIGNSYWNYSDLLEKDKLIAGCLDRLLGKCKSVYKWNEVYHFDIRELCTDFEGRYYYKDGNKKRAKYIYDELNELIKKIFIKTRMVYKKKYRI